MNNLLPENQSYIFEIKTILHQARQKAYATIHSEMVWAYWQIGKRIVDEEQQGAERAQYGQQIIQTLSDELTREFGRGKFVSFINNFLISQICEQCSHN